MDSIYKCDINLAFKKTIDHHKNRLKLDKEDSKILSFKNLNKFKKSKISSNRINNNLKNKIHLESKKLIKSIDTKSFKELIEDQINLNDIIDELPVKKLDNFIMNKLKDLNVSKSNESSIETASKLLTEKSNESSIETASKLLTEKSNESSIETASKLLTEKSNESSIEKANYSLDRSFKKFKRDNFKLLDNKNETFDVKKTDNLNEDMIIDSVQINNSPLNLNKSDDLTSNFNENTTDLTESSNLIQNLDINKSDNLTENPDTTELNNLTTNLNESNNLTTNFNEDMTDLTESSNQIGNEDLDKLDNSTENHKTNLIQSDDSSNHNKSNNSLENLSTVDNQSDKLLKENNSNRIEDFPMDSFVVVDEFQVDDFEKSSSNLSKNLSDCGSKNLEFNTEKSEDDENLSIKKASIAIKFDLFSNLFTRLNVDNEIVKSIKLLNLKNNEISFNQTKEISEFLFNNNNSHLFIRSKPFHKKLSYLVYILNQINTNHSYTQAVIVSSTIELSNQIKSSIKLLVKFKPEIKYKILSPDYDYFDKIKDHLICCTSGTLVHCIKKEITDLHRVKLCVFEEFDILNSVRVDRGYDDNTVHFQKLLRHFNFDCQQIYFSTNLDSTSLKSAKLLSTNRLKILNLLDKDKNLFDNILHLYVNCDDKISKYDNLIKLFRNMTSKNVLIFTIGKGFPKNLKEKLDKDNTRYNLNLRIGLLSSDCTIDYRLKSLKEFKKNKRNVLIITYPINVGLELGDVDMIINYDMTYYDERFLYKEYFGKTIYLNRFKPTVMFAITFLPSKRKDVIKNLSNKFNINMYRLDLSNY